MTKKLFSVSMALLFSVAVSAQEWVGFGSRGEGSPPEINVQRNDNQQVSFTVSLSGMYVESKTGTGSVYKRLSMPECQTTNEVGSPEIPVISKMIAIPECSNFSITVTMSEQQTFSNYVVYPVPEQEARSNGDGTFYVAEVFTKDAAAYSQNAMMPANSYTTIDTGYMRAQRYLRLELHPVQYNPVTKVLLVATEIEVNLQFANATTTALCG
jgi:hypothetical protein